MKMYYITQPPKRYTFEQPKLKKFVEMYCRGITLNLFAGKTKLDIPNEIRNDINNEMPAHYHVDAFQLLEIFYYNDKKSFETVILDPPYSYRKSMEKYGGKTVSSMRKLRDVLPNFVQSNGVVISLGYDSVGMSRSRGFEKIALCVVCHGGAHHDTLCLVERKIS